MAEALDWPGRYLQVLPGEAVGALRQLFNQTGLQLSTHYSGIGTAETMAEFLAAALTETPKLSVYHACDWDQERVATFLGKCDACGIRP